MGLIDAADNADWVDRPRIDMERPALLGSECGACGRHSWPSRSVCERCGGVVTTTTRFASTGELLAFTTIHVPREGIPAPYVLGLIELEHGVRIHAQVRGTTASTTVPQPVELAVAPVWSHAVAFWFEASA